MKNRTHAEIIVLVSCILGAVGIVPFTVYRFLMGDYVMALLDTVICFITFGLFTYVWLTGKHKFAGGMICILYLSAAVTIVYLKGPSTIYWAYPATLGCFCIINSRLAMIFSGITIAALFPLLHNQMPNEQLIGFFLTISLLCLFGYIFNSSVHQQRQQLSTLAARDALTGAWNRRALDETLIQTTSSNIQTPLTASLIMLDLDHFKRINDTYGHDIGDVILIKIAEIIRGSIRSTDRLYRYGGEEFVVIAEGADRNNAALIAESIRKKVEESSLFEKEEITISLGVATLEEGQTPSTWIKLADDALYKAKRTGRNKFCLAEMQIDFSEDEFVAV